MEQYRINIYGRGNTETLVLIHEFQDEGSAVWNLLSEAAGQKVTLAGISGITWEHELTPWEAPALFKKADPFTGGADEYLEKVTETILPEIYRRTDCRYDRVIIAGYSLAGLFAVYAAMKTDCFDGFVSASGSLWYPDFLSYAEAHPVSERVKTAYFSIGDKEAKTKNPVMQTVEENTRKIEHMVQARGVKTKFELNRGGHFSEENERLAKGIEWISTGGTV